MQIKVPLKKTGYLIGLLGLVAFTFLYFSTRAHPSSAGTFEDNRVVRFQSQNNKSLKAYVAETPEARQQGLSGTKTLPEGYGVLFLFDKPGSYMFWMKDMYMSLDLVYISPEKKIIEVISHVSPETYPKTFQSQIGPYDAVLEIPAGESEKYGLIEGAKVEW